MTIWGWCWQLRKEDHLHLVCCVFVVGFVLYILHQIHLFHIDGFQVSSMWQMLAPEFGNIFVNHKMLLGTPKRSPKKCKSIRLPTQGDPSLANMEFPLLLPELDMHQSGSSKAVLRRMLDGKSKEEKSKKRKTFQESRIQKKRFPNQTLLEQEAISNEVANDYMIRMQAFRVFVKQECLSVKGEANLDNALTYYLNYLFEEGHDLGDGTKTLAAVLDSNPGCGQRTRLPRSRRSLQGWNRLDPQKTRPPLPWGLVALIALELAKEGHIIECLTVLLSFVAYLRPGEALSITENKISSFQIAARIIMPSTSTHQTGKRNPK